MQTTTNVIDKNWKALIKPNKLNITSNEDKTIAKVDLKHLILETDSPYLAPTPFRGKRNESKYIVNIAEKLADVH